MPDPISHLSRREFVTSAVIAAAAMQVVQRARAQQQAPAADLPPLNVGEGVEVRWLEGSAPSHSPGTTWGVPWPKGKLQKVQTFALKTESGEGVPMQSWSTAYWPDGSLKWTAHAIGADAGLSRRLVLAPGATNAPAQAIRVSETDSAIDIDTGAMKVKLNKRGNAIIESIEREGRPILGNGHLVVLRQDQPSAPEGGVAQQEKFTGQILSVAVEQTGPVRAVVKIEGNHRGINDRTWLPFVVRLYFHAGGDAIRVLHTFIFDGDEQKDFISGIGLRFAVPMRGELHDRHVRFGGEGDGLFAEGVRGLTGLRRDPGPAFKNSQLTGTATPPVDQLPNTVRPRLGYIPAWGDYSLWQLSSDGFEVKKRTKAGYGWIKSAAGQRASGFGYIGSPTGGVAFGMRDFWQKYPAQLDIRNAHTESAEVTMWLYSPDAPPMDLRFYHDGMGQETHAQELEGLEITYEDYEKGFGTPVGIARTSEMMLWAVAATPAREKLAQMSHIVQAPPQMVCAPKHYLDAKVFGGLWSLPDRSIPAKAQIEDQLDFLFDFYKNQVEQRRWYGFWDYGDVMHSYDNDRHEWKYDVGGFAWDNSELSPDLWLWYSFLRSGRADIFRFAEAMTRHTGEVDVYHLGRFKMLGSRHNVQHWGCSAKQNRISTAIYRRFYYFLTADERTGDLVHEQIDSDQTFLTLDPIRKIRQGAYAPDPHAVSVGFGTDWGSLASAWMTEWERTNDPKWRDKMLNGMRTIAAQPKGFYTGSALFDPATGAFQISTDTRASASHLSAVFGLAEICAELITMLDMPEFEKAWLHYCELYNAGGTVQQQELGNGLGNLNLGEAHSRMTAYAAKRTNDPALAQRAWTEFYGGAAGYGVRANLQTQRIEGPAVLNPVDEAAWVSTNATAQWGLAAIQCLALIGDSIPATPPTRGGRRGRG